MPLKQIILLFFILTPHLFTCSSSSRLTEDAAQKDITLAVNNYNSENWEIRLESIKNISRYSDTIYAKNSMLLLLKAIEDNMAIFLAASSPSTSALGSDSA